MDGLLKGDVVRIISPEEYRELGCACSDDCAIAYYADSICSVDIVHDYGYKLTPITTVRNFPLAKNPTIEPIEYYMWDEMAIELYEEPLSNPNDGFIDVF